MLKRRNRDNTLQTRDVNNDSYNALEPLAIGNPMTDWKQLSVLLSLYLR